MADVFTPIAAYTAFAAERDMISTLLGGTNALRLAGTKYLPKEPGEDDEDYRARLSRSVLVNQFDRTVKAVVGKVFNKPLIFKHLPTVMAGWVEDIDMEGNHLDVFARSWFRDAVAYGISFCLVEMPKSTKPRDRRTMLDDRLENLRPYLVHIPASKLIGWRHEIIGGRPVLVQARIREDAWVAEGEFGERWVERVRVLRPGSWEVIEKGKDDDGKEIHTVIDRGETGLDFVPLVPVNLNPVGRFIARPPLQNLAELNVRHFQSLSDQNNILKIARVPLLHIARNRDANGDEDTDLVIGGNRAIETGPNDKIAFVEHTGAAIGAGQADLDNLMEQMQAAGMQMTPRETSGDVTATENSLVAAEAHAALTAMSNDFADALELTLLYMARMAGVNAEPSVVITKDFTASASAGDMQSLLQMFEAGAITKETLLNESKRRGVLAEDVEVAKEVANAEPPVDQTNNMAP